MAWRLAITLAMLASHSVTAQYTVATYSITGAIDPLVITSATIGQTVNSATITPTSDPSVVVGTCPLGTWAAAGSDTCTNCGAGKYSITASADSEAACVSCVAGKYSTVLGASTEATCQNCAANTYSATSAGASSAVCLGCPLQASSPEASSKLTDCVCNPGYKGANGQACQACGTSEWCFAGGANSCPPHSTALPKSSTLDQCLCNPGYYGDPTLCQFCKEDHYCPGGAVNLTYACLDGKYSFAGSDDPTDCMCPDHATSQQKAIQASQCVCDSGYYRVYSSAATLGGWTCQLCKPGEFCYDNTNRTCPPHSTSLGVAKSVQDCYCLPGYANVTSPTELELCTDCPANSYCTGKGAKETCVANAISPSQSPGPSKCYCDWGWKGLNNSACVACQSPTFCYGGIEAQCYEGTFSSPKSWDRMNCSCVSGWWGPMGGPCRACSAGKYNLLPGCKACDAYNDTDCTKCEVGTASSVEGRNSTCDPCKAGTASSADGRTCDACGNGTFSLARAGNCSTCELGWWAAAGSSACTACPRDTYLDVGGKGGAEACQPCPLGTVSAKLGNSDPQCSACPPGTFQLNGECTSCPAGTYSRTGSVSCRPCLAGTYSGANATLCMDCAVGSYNNRNSSTGCQTCGVGYFAELLASTVCLACPIGSISTVNGSGGCASCNKGLYAPSGSSVVSPKCEFLWFLVALTQAFWQCTACPAGSWSSSSIGSADNCTSCGVGKYSEATGQWRDGVCTLCLAGTYSDKARGVKVSACFSRFYSKIAKIGYFSPNSWILSRISRARRTECCKSSSRSSKRAVRVPPSVPSVSESSWA